jgi:hypothetical protein
LDALHDFPTHELVALYRGAASRHGDATLSSDASSANSDADLIAAVYRELRRRDERTALLSLLASDELGIRSWAAAMRWSSPRKKGNRCSPSLRTTTELD